MIIRITFKVLRLLLSVLERFSFFWTPAAKATRLQELAGNFRPRLSPDAQNRAFAKKKKLHSNPRNEPDWSKKISLNFSCFSPTFSKNTPFSRFYLTAVNPPDDTELCRIFSNYFSNIVYDKRISNLFDI